MTIRDILARREAIRTELRGLLEQHPDGNLPDEVRSRSDALETEATRLNDQERRQALVDDMDRRATGTPIGGTGDSRLDQLAAKVTAVDVMRAQMGATDAAAGRAREVSRELEKRSGRNAEGLYWPFRQAAPHLERRTLGLSTGAGSNLIATEVSPATIDVLRAKSVVIQAGATVLSDLVGNVAIPRLTTSATVGWVADGTGLTQSNPTFDQVTLSPKHCGGIVGISRSILQQSSPDVSQLVENDLAALIATAIDTAALAGTAAPSPVGILSTSGLPIVAGGTNGSAITYANVQALIASVDTSNALDGRLAFVMNAKVGKSMRTTLKSSLDTTSNFIVTVPGQLAGYPSYSTQNVPSNLTKGSGTALSALIFGDFSSLIIGSWSMLDILVNPMEATAYAAGAVLIRAMATVDVGVRHITSFAAITDIIAP